MQLIKFFVLALFLAVVGFAIWRFVDFGSKASSEDVLAQSLAVQVNSEGEVEISVQPKKISPTSATWDFKISMDTHSVELNDDLTAVSLLVADGNVFSPVAWEGPSEGGHHRGGILKFPAVNPLPQTLEILIRGVGDVPMRSFGWEL